MVALLQPVTLCTQQIFRTAGVGAVEDLIEVVGMEGYFRIGETYIPVGIHKTGVHFYFLIEIIRINALAAQKGPDGFHIPFANGFGKRIADFS